MAETRQCEDLDKEIQLLIKEGYRVDMITPADGPREVQLSRNGEILRLVLSSNFSWPKPAEDGTQNSWIAGRAGMMYRDLLPDRLGGKLIASHIRLTEGGPVADYVHYHKVDFQLIYCLKGRIKVVYEDQGPPFWLEPGDGVLQPPEIRHRVLECEAGSEVLELSSAAEHETWVEHEITLPTAKSDPERLFGGQRFVRSIAKEANWQSSDSDGVELRDLGLDEATDGLIAVTIRRTQRPEALPGFSPRPGMTGLAFVVAGKERGPETDIIVDETAQSITTEILRLEFRDDIR